jgi:hypothetical protein
MGLDMYLYKKSYLLSGDWIKEEARESVTITKGGQPHPNIKSDRVKYIIEEVGYWRKANAIHKWFVDNVQDGVDNCSIYDVSTSQLEDLLSLCKTVLEDKDKAPELLPAQSGFFFGNTDYDEYYFGDLIQTMEIIEDCLSDNDAEFQYSSSW